MTLRRFVPILAVFLNLACGYYASPALAVPGSQKAKPVPAKSPAAKGPRVITLAAPNGLPANGQVPFTVTGDSLGSVGLRVWSVQELAGQSSPQKLIYSTVKTASKGDVIFRAPLKASGLYLAEACAGAVTSSAVFRLVAVAAKTLSLSSVGKMRPSKRVPFIVTASNWRFQSANLRVWKVESGPAGTRKLVWQGSGKRKKPKPKSYEEDVNGVSFYVPLTSSGLYLAQADSANLHALASVRISDLGVAVKRGPGELLAYAVRVTNGAPIGKAAVRIDDSGTQRTDAKGRTFWVRRPNPPRALQAGTDGVARFYGVPGDGQTKVTVSAPDGSQEQLDAPLEQSDQNDKTLFFYTERPIYRPGQRVYFKGVARQDLTLKGLRQGNSIFKPLVARRVLVEVTDAANRKIETRDLKTSGMGTFNGSIDLPSDAAVGHYTIETRLFEAGGKTASPFYNRFSVEEYRKPEYEVAVTPLLQPGKTWARQGDSYEILVQAKYLFGGPVKSAKVVYSGDASGETALDERGEVKITVSNPDNTYNDADTTRTVRIQVTDDANRIVEATSQVFAPWNEITPSLKFDRAVYDLQKTASLEATLKDPAGRPVSAAARLQLFCYRSKTVKDRETLAVRTIDEEIIFFDQQIRTAANGRVLIPVKLGKWGYIKATLTASDSADRTRTGQANTWVIKPGEVNYYGYDMPSLDVIADKPEVAPGETVKTLILNSDPGQWALVTLQSDRIFFHRVVHLTSQATPFSFVMPAAAAPGAHFTVGLARGGRWDSQSVYLRSLSPSQHLNIDIKPGQKQYRPGDTATYQLKTTDGNGKPRAAELSFGLVDKAIYSLAADETPDPEAFFYAQRLNRISTNWSQPEELDGGSYQRIEKPVTVRSRFEDTAYWNPTIQTDANGLAKLSIPLPDNLTTWRATARGVTIDTAAGAATADLLVTKPFLVRLIAPRFWTQDDRLRVQVIVQNNTSARQPVRVSLRGDNTKIEATVAETSGAQTGSIPANGSASFTWDVEAPQVPATGNIALTTTGRADSPGFSAKDSTDAMKLDFPVKAHGVRLQKIASGVLKDQEKNTTLNLDSPGAIANASRLEISLSPSLAGPMLSALPDLAQYPYGCTEQTLSRFVPAVIAAKTLRDLKQPLPESMKELPKQVKAGLRILYDFQHSDGGWGWWAEDDSDPYMTGAVLYGLALTQEAGYPVERARIVKGLRAVQNLFSQSSQQRYGQIVLISPDTRAWMMLGYASAMRTFKVKLTEELGTNEDYPGAVIGVYQKLSNYGLAALTLAAVKTQHPQAGKLLKELESRATIEKLSTGEGASWLQNTSDGGWADSDIETTALALQAEIIGRPNSPLILPALRSLMLKRQGLTWASTKDTAQVVLALATYLKTSRELSPDETITLHVNDKLIKSLHFGKGDIGGEPPLVKLEHLSAGAKIAIERSGSGSVYYSAKLTSYSPEKLTNSEQNGLELQRIYSVRDKKGHWRPVQGPIPDGVLVRVDLQVTTSKAYQYLLLEDPLPAGFEFRPEDDAQAQEIEYEVDPACDCRRTQIDPPIGWEPLQVTRRENRDDRAAFFLSLLPGKRREQDPPRRYYLRYILRPEQPGTRTALPARIEAMYHPDINARSAENKVEVAAIAAR